MEQSDLQANYDEGDCCQYGCDLESDPNWITRVNENWRNKANRIIN